MSERRYPPPMPSGLNWHGSASAGVVVHHNTIFDGRHPTACGEVRAPATDDWRHVSCPACLATQNGAGPGSTTS